MAGVQVPIVRPWFCLVYEQHQVAFRPVPDFRGYVKALGLATGDCFRNPPDHLAVMVAHQSGARCPVIGTSVRCLPQFAIVSPSPLQNFLS
jgi:hypothetical protein